MFNESFSYLQNSLGENLGIFFLVQDFVSMTKTNNQKETEKGWHDVAWAFLKPFPTKEVDNTRRRLRLQLFKPNPRPKDPEDETRIVWGWWKKNRKKYPSSLYVTVQGWKPPLAGDQKQLNDVSQNPGSTEGPASMKAVKTPKIPIWSRLPGQSCKIPNRIEHVFGDSIFTQINHVKFSCNGRLLGVADGSKVHVFEVPTWIKLATLKGHVGPVYELDFNDESDLLASASGDQTLRVWNLADCTDRPFHANVLEHPSFVYCVRFHPSSSHTVLATGSYDKVVRIWKRTEDAENGNFVVTQELISHSNFVTALEFGFEGQMLFSGDRMGTVNVWETIVGGVKDHYIFKLKKNVSLAELGGYTIESLHLHPGGRRLLIHSSSVIRFAQVNILLVRTHLY